jgi:hypothetical protein
VFTARYELGFKQSSLRFVLKGLSHNRHSNNILLPEERDFRKGMCVEMAAFRLIGNVLKECVVEEFSVIC